MSEAANEVKVQGYYQPCTECAFPVLIVNGKPNAPGGITMRRSLEGVVYVTPHRADCGLAATEPALPVAGALVEMSAGLLP